MRGKELNWNEKRGERGYWNINKDLASKNLRQ